MARCKLEFHDLGRLKRLWNPDLQTLENPQKIPPHHPHPPPIPPFRRITSFLPQPCHDDRLCLDGHYLRRHSPRPSLLSHFQKQTHHLAQQRLVDLPDFCIYLFYKTFLPLRFELRPRHRQRNGLEYRQIDGSTNRRDVEYYPNSRNITHLFVRLHYVRHRNAHPLAAGQMETPISR